MRKISGLIMAVFFLFMLAGCGSIGSSFSDLGDSFASGFAGGSGSGGGGNAGSGAQVAMLHQPEPATMLLWGIGLAGAALLKKRRKQ